MPHYVILNAHMGVLEWSGEAPSDDRAFVAYYLPRRHTIDPDGHGWYSMKRAFTVYEVTPEQRAEVEAWHRSGGRPHEFPLNNE